MREILFRGKGFYSEEWVEGYLAIGRRETDNAKEHAIIPVDVIFWEYGVSDLIQVIPETICQYTGMTDRNGNRIWENDVLKDRRFKYKVVWDEEEGALMCESISGARYGIGKINCMNFEVIGNIFDNPELLERNRYDD